MNFSSRLSNSREAFGHQKTFIVYETVVCRIAQYVNFLQEALLMNDESDFLK